MNSYLKWLGVGLAVLIVLLGAGYAYRQFTKKQASESQSRSVGAMATGRVEFGKGNDVVAIASLKQAVVLANGNQYSESAAKLALGVYTAAVSDSIAGVNLLKEVANTENYDPIVRARAIDGLEDHYYGTLDVDFAKAYIFSGSSFGSFLESGDVALAARKLYEYANTIYPTAKAELRIADWYAIQLREKSASLAPSVEKEYLGIIREKISNADKLFPSSSQADTFTFAHIYMLKANAEQTLSKFGKDDFSKAENDYKQALKIIQTEINDINLQDLDRFTRFHYAAGLKEIFGTNRTDDIKELLKNFNTPSVNAAIKNRYFDKFLASEISANVRGTLRYYQDITDLAKISPEFKAKAESVGWAFK